MTALRKFLLVFNNRTRESEWTEYVDSIAAFEHLNARERAKLPEEEVILFGAEKLDDLRIAHPRFFDFPMKLAAREDGSPYLA